MRFTERRVALGCFADLQSAWRGIQPRSRLVCYRQGRVELCGTAECNSALQRSVIVDSVRIGPGLKGRDAIPQPVRARAPTGRAGSKSADYYKQAGRKTAG